MYGSGVVIETYHHSTASEPRLPKVPILETEGLRISSGSVNPLKEEIEEALVE